MRGSIVAVCFALISLEQTVHGRSGISNEGDLDRAVGVLTKFVDSLEEKSPSEFHSSRYRRGAPRDDDDSDDSDRGVTNLDIRDAILQLLNVIRDGTKANERHDRRVKQDNEEVLKKLVDVDGKALERKIDNISTFLLRINSKLQLLLRSKGRQPGGGAADSNEVLETLAKESFDILTLIPEYINANNKAIAKLSEKTDTKFGEVEQFLTIDDNDDDDTDQVEDNPSGRKSSISKVVKRTEKNILKASKELKDIVVESGQMAENLFERVNEGYHELNRDIKGFANVEKVLLDTADSVMDTKKKIEFGVQQIIYKIGELVKTSGGTMNSKLQVQFEDITRTILANQNEALGNLTSKMEKEIGQVWRQMGIMYGKVSNSLDMLEKVKAQTETYVNDTGLNLGTMGGQVEGLADRIVDVDENLNYMLGQLSLVVQEFDQVKTGLGEAISGLGSELDEIKEYNLEEGVKPEDPSGN